MANPALILTSRLQFDGVIVSGYMEEWPAALQELSDLVGAGKLTYRQSVAAGLASAPEAFIGLLKGKNFGTQTVRPV